MEALVILGLNFALSLDQKLAFLKQQSYNNVLFCLKNKEKKRKGKKQRKKHTNKDSDGS